MDTYSCGSWILRLVLCTIPLYYLIVQAKTPGREDDDEESLLAPPGGNGTPSSSSKAAQILENIGGPSNIRNIDACITRLRLIVNDEKPLKIPH